MQRWFRNFSIIAAAALLVGCSFPMLASGSPGRFPSPVAVTIFPPASDPGQTASGHATAVPPPELPAGAVAPTETPVHIFIATPSPDTSQMPPTPADGYLDDRSTAVSVVQSLFNAINRREYLRAYSYWENAGINPTVQAFAQFQQGYEDTASVQVTTGVLGGEVSAGQMDYTVPVVLQALTTGGQAQVFAGCYTLHLSQADVQPLPPFQGLAITSGVLSQAPASAEIGDLLAQGCAAAGIPQADPVVPPPAADPVTIAASNYLDNRSDAIEVLRSLFNAINRKEYARAYSYWEGAGVPQSVPDFLDFENGYQDTAAVDALFGNPSRDGGAGNFYFHVPVVLKVQTTQGESQTFAGCYVIQLTQPSTQDVPPFEPLGIRSASVRQVANEADTAGLLTTLCDAVP